MWPKILYGQLQYTRILEYCENVHLLYIYRQSMTVLERCTYIKSLDKYNQQIHNPTTYELTEINQDTTP